MMSLDRITAQHSDAELEAGLRHAQTVLAAGAQNGNHAHSLLADLHRIAEEQALLQVAVQVRNIRRGRADEPMEDVNQRIRDFLISRLCADPDDTWSGRGKNDLNRVMNDAVRVAVSNAIELL